MKEIINIGCELYQIKTIQGDEWSTFNEIGFIDGDLAYFRDDNLIPYVKFNYTITGRKAVKISDNTYKIRIKIKTYNATFLADAYCEVA